MTQPLSAEVERALTREFPPDQQTAARSMLAGYGVAAHEREVERVRRALLALSQGRLAYLGHYLAVAQHDYRDVLRRVVARGLDPARTTVGEVLTSSVVTCEPQTTIDECAALMTARHIRHLPVREAGRLVGLVTIGDILAFQVSEQQTTIEQMNNYLFDLR